MTLSPSQFFEALHAVPLLRKICRLPSSEVPVICHATELDAAVRFYRQEYSITPELYVLDGQDFDHWPHSARPLADLPQGIEPHLFFLPARSPAKTAFKGLSDHMHGNKMACYSVESFSCAQFWGQKKITFSKDDLAKIIVVYNALSDDDSKKTYLAAIRARMEGHAGYIPISSYPQYFHPLVSPGHGDCLCEGGVDNGVSTLHIAGAVGDGGHVYAFEPAQTSYENCKAVFAPHANITLENAALWSSKGVCNFAMHEDALNAARIAENGEGNCFCYSVDDYFADTRLDFLKLDIEGAELPCLTGAKNTIERHKPKLSVCIYHNQARDLVDVPWHIVSSAQGYTQFYVGHHARWFNETVFYAR